MIKPFWIFGIDRTVQNVVGAESYGLYFSLFNFSMILNIFLDLGITNFNNRNIAQHSQLLPKYLKNIVGLKFLLAIGYAIVCMLAGLLIGYNKIQFHLLGFLILNQFLISFTLYLRSNISGLQFFRTDSLLSVLDRSVMILICGVLLFSNWFKESFTIDWFVYAQTAAYLVSTIVTFLVLLKYSGTFKINFDWAFFGVILRQSYPYALLILLMSFYYRIDSVLIERLLPDAGKEQAGIYAQAFRLLDAFSMFGVLFAGLLLPMFARMIKEKQNISQMVRLSYLLIIVPAILVTVASNTYHVEIMKLLYREHVALSAPIFRVLMIGSIGVSTSYIFGTLLTANGSMKQLNLMAASGMFINIVLNVIFIPRFEALGAAWVSLTTQLFTAIVQIFIAIRIFKLQTNFKLLLNLLGFLLFSILAAKASYLIGNWILGLLIFGIAGLLYAFLVRLLNMRALLQVIRNDQL